MNSSPLLILIEDDEILGRSLEQRFRLEGYRVRWAQSAAQARAVLDDGGADMVLSDIRLPDGTGEVVVRDAFERHGALPVIFMTAYGDIEQAVRLVKLGARDYIAKPFNVDELVERVAMIVEAGTAAAPSSDPFACFGVSGATQALRSTLDRLANSDLPVLLTGETGTGKEVAARYLHEKTSDGKDPFVPVNCAAVPADLFESAFFGHERGAFTGAATRHQGYVEQAAAGTLFLDEVGELSQAHQAKLLRLIESREYQRLGSTSIMRCNARFVFATNRDLDQAVAQGTFRSDLLYRINVVQCHMPPLRERRDEVVPLLRFHARRIAGRRGESTPEISAAVEIHAQQHAWPGNVRELVNRVERGIALGDPGRLLVRDLWPEIPRSGDVGEQDLSLAGAREAAERDRIVQVLASCDGNLSEAARILDVSRTTLWSKMQKYGIHT